MKKLLYFIIVLVLFGGGLFFVNEIYKGPTNIKAQKQLDEKVSVVREFWENSKEGKKTDHLIILPPKEFYDESSRCLRGDSNADKTSIDVELSSNKKDDPFFQNLKETAGKIRNENWDLLENRTERHWKNEAIVEVDYSLPDSPFFKRKRFFFLIKSGEQWKIFFDTSILDLLNKEYAKYECSK